MIGRILCDQYQIIEQVGTGGMALVYRAIHLETGGEVAIKMLREEYSEDEEFLRRFEREAQAASKVSHKNIVETYGVGEDQGRRFIVMEYLHSVTLKQIIRERGYIQEKDAIAIGMAIARALDHAHKNHIVHRDIKPQNILIDDQGKVKVTDFGIARVTDSQTVTFTDGTVMGSVHYFSPEQARGKPVDAKSDIYSLGAVLYEMVTGHVPFDDESPVAIALKHIQQPPVLPSKYVSGISKALEDVIMKALSKKKEDRYQSAAELEVDLRMALLKPAGGFVKLPPRSSGTRSRDVPVIHVTVEGDRRPPVSRRKGLLHTLLILLAGVLITLIIVIAVFTQINAVRIPNLYGYTEEEASNMVRERGLSPDVEYQTSETVPKGLIVGQNPEAEGSAQRGSRITLIISSGSGTVEVPHVVNEYEEDARGIIEGAGLLVGEVIDRMSDNPRGVIEQQSPQAGEMVEPNTPINLWRSGSNVEVPDVVGMDREEARTLLAELELTLEVSENVRSDLPAGRIISQLPGKNTRTYRGDKVIVTVSAAKENVYTQERKIPIDIPEDGGELRVDLVYPNGEKATIVEQSYDRKYDADMSIVVQSEYTGEHKLEIYVDDALVNTDIFTIQEGGG